jgi:predicted phage tail protein
MVTDDVEIRIGRQPTPADHPRPGLVLRPAPPQPAGGAGGMFLTIAGAVIVVAAAIIGVVQIVAGLA